LVFLVSLDWSHECSRIFDSIRWVRSVISYVTFSLRRVAPSGTDHYFFEGKGGLDIFLKRLLGKNRVRGAMGKKFKQVLCTNQGQVFDFKKFAIAHWK